MLSVFSLRNVMSLKSQNSEVWFLNDPQDNSRCPRQSIRWKHATMPVLQTQLYKIDQLL